MFNSVKLPDGIQLLIWTWDVPGPSITNHSTQAMRNGNFIPAEKNDASNKNENDTRKREFKTKAGGSTSRMLPKSVLRHTISPSESS